MVFMHAKKKQLFFISRSIQFHAFSVNVPSIKKYHGQHSNFPRVTYQLRNLICSWIRSQSGSRPAGFSWNLTSAEIHRNSGSMSTENALFTSRASLVVFLCLIDGQGPSPLLFSRCVLRGFHVYVRDPNRMVDIWFSNCCRRSSARKTLPWWQNVKEDGQEERIVGHKKFMLELDIHTFSKAKAMSKMKT